MTNLNPQLPPDAAATAAAAAAAAAAVSAPGPHAPPDDVEETYYEGSPLLRGALGKGVLWIIAGVILVVLPIASMIMDWKFPWFVSLALAVIGFILILIPIIQTKTIRYRITNYRIDYERGLLSKDINTLELWHVEDLRFHQSLLDRILGVGDIQIISHDETMPMLNMRSIPHPRPLFEQLKQRVIAVKRSRGVIKMDPG
jgi:membrane protein YdbS with pleckstrin-like domain